MGNCKDCRFWSEMIAHALEGQLEAYCLAPNGPHHGRFTPRLESCDHWADGSLGAVDVPPYDKYDADPTPIGEAHGWSRANG